MIRRVKSSFFCSARYIGRQVSCWFHLRPKKFRWFLKWACGSRSLTVNLILACRRVASTGWRFSCAYIVVIEGHGQQIVGGARRQRREVYEFCSYDESRYLWCDSGNTHRRRYWKMLSFRVIWFCPCFCRINWRWCWTGWNYRGCINGLESLEDPWTTKVPKELIESSKKNNQISLKEEIKYKKNRMKLSINRIIKVKSAWKSF